MIKHQRRVVVTGLGWVTSLGFSVDQVFNDLLAGKSGIKRVTKFDTSQYDSKIGGEISDWDGGPHIEKREAKRLDKFTQFAMSAAIDAVNDAGLVFDDENRGRTAVVIGTGIGGIEEFEMGHRKLLERGPDRVSPFVVPKLMCNAGPGNIAIYYRLKGPNFATVTACASAATAIACATDCIRQNMADIAIAGGTEAALTPLGVACFIALKALSRRNDEPENASRPFDRDRDGFIMAEGAGVIILEELEHARKRNAKIYAEVLGCGQSADGYHITAPDESGTGAASAMDQAMRDAALAKDQIGYINAHGTSTDLGDLAEVRAIKRLFSHDADKLMISSTKSMTGHLLGATGGVEAIVIAKAIETGQLPPTVNLDNPGEECDLDFIPHTARQVNITTAMSNSFGFGGHNVSLIFGKA